MVFNSLITEKKNLIPSMKSVFEYEQLNNFSQLRHEIGPFSRVKIGEKISLFKRIL